MSLALATSARYVSLLEGLELSSLPAFPTVRDDLIQTALTHTSYHQLPHVDFESAQGSPPDYERHEFIGDQIIGLAVTFLITETYPLLTVGASTHIKGALVANSTLCEISRAYSLHTRLRAHVAQSVLLRKNPLVRAQIFEASVCSINLQYGLDFTLSWLKTIFQPLLTVLYEEARETRAKTAAAQRQAAAEKEGFKSYVADLEMWRMRKGVKTNPVIEYVKTGTEGPPHKRVHMGMITVDGEEMGSAQGDQWKNVRNQLAKLACDKLNVPY